MQYVLILAEITDFDVDGILTGFSHENGRLNVLKSGIYYIYAQAFFGIFRHVGDLRNRVGLAVNGEVVSYLQSTYIPEGSDYGSRFTGAIKRLTKGDHISLIAVFPCELWMVKSITFFGAIKFGN